MTLILRRAVLLIRNERRAHPGPDIRRGGSLFEPNRRLASLTGDLHREALSDRLHYYLFTKGLLKELGAGEIIPMGADPS